MEAGKGIIFEYSSKLAKRLKSLVFVGYAERDGYDIYNSMMIIS
jgi:hypothetical protein